MTKQEARDLGFVQLYEWSAPREMLDTQYGRISVRNWLSWEKRRIESDPERAAEIVEHCGFLALFVDPVV